MVVLEPTQILYYDNFLIIFIFSCGYAVYIFYSTYNYLSSVLPVSYVR